MIQRGAYDKIREIADRSGQCGDVAQYRALRTIEELGGLVKAYRKSGGLYLKKYHACAELFICALVNAMCVSSVPLAEVNQRLAMVVRFKSEQDFLETDSLLASMAATVGKMAAALEGEGLAPAEFAFFSLALVDDSYRFMKCLVPEDPNDEYLNQQLDVIHQMWCAKARLSSLEHKGDIYCSPREANA